MGGWVATRTHLDDLEKRKLQTVLGLEFQSLGHPALEPVAILTVLPLLLFEGI
jgi:hypothetical protein